MTISREFRSKGWNDLKGKYGTGLAVTLIEAVIVSAVSLFTGAANIPFLKTNVMVTALCSIIGLLLTIFITNPIFTGVNRYFINAAGGNGKTGDMFNSFKEGYLGTVKTMLLVSVKTVLWTILFIVPGIIKSYEYAMIPYIIGENPETTSKEAFLKSKKMMTGNKWRFFKLQFSFIGWILLCVLTAGIGFIFLRPYLYAAYTEFYLEMKENVA